MPLALHSYGQSPTDVISRALHAVVTAQQCDLFRQNEVVQMPTQETTEEEVQEAA